VEFEYPPGPTPLDRDEMDGLKIQSIETRRQLDRFEQINLQEGLRWLARAFTDTVRQWRLGEHPVSWLGDEMQHPGEVREQYIRSLRMADTGDYSDLIAFIAERV